MGKIVIFGDSFAQYYKNYYSHQPHSWHDYLGGDFISYGLEGSGIWYSINKLIEYVNSDKYEPDDRIVFFVTSCKRAIRYTDDLWPEKHNQIVRNTSNDPNWKSYKKKNQKAFDYIYDSILTETFHINTERMLYAFLEKLPNIALILPCFLIDKLDNPKVINYNPYYHIHNNKIIYSKSFSLFRASMLEFKGYDEGVNYIQMTGETRKNHFSDENHHVLANLIGEYFQTRDMSIFKLERFCQNIRETTK